MILPHLLPLPFTNKHTQSKQLAQQASSSQPKKNADHKILVHLLCIFATVPCVHGAHFNHFLYKHREQESKQPAAAQQAPASRPAAAAVP